MGNRRQRKKQRVTVQRTPEAETMSTPELEALIAILEEARAEQRGMSTDAMDVSRASQYMAEHPALLTTMEAIQQRQAAREMATYAAPSYPQAQSINGGTGLWSSDKDENEPSAVDNARMYRQWADSCEWVRAAINIRRKQVESMKPSCMPIDPKKKYDKKVQAEVNRMLRAPNELRDSWRALIGPVLEDVFVIDRGVLLKNMTVDRKPISLYYEDGATISIYPAWSGSAKEPRYLYTSPNKKVVKPLRNDECIVMMDNTATHRYGLSTLASLQKTIEADLAATSSAAQLMSMKPPAHAIQIPKASPKQIQEIATNYQQKIAGKKSLFWFSAAEQAHLFPLIYSARDQQFLEYQVYLGRKIAVLFQLSPQKLGILNDVNRATADSQDDIDEDRGLVPILLFLEEYMNSEVLGDYAPLDSLGMPDLLALNLKVFYPQVSEAQRKLHAKETITMLSQAMPGLPSITVNMGLSMLGEEPIPGGNTMYTNVPVYKYLSYDEPIEEMAPNKEPEPLPTPTAPEEGGNPDEKGDKKDDPAEGGKDDAKGKKGDDTEKPPKGKANQYDYRMPGENWSLHLSRLY